MKPISCDELLAFQIVADLSAPGESVSSRRDSGTGQSTNQRPATVSRFKGRRPRTKVFSGVEHGLTWVWVLFPTENLQFHGRY